MSVYGYFVLTAAGYFLKLEFVRKMVGFYGQITNSEQLSARKRFIPDMLVYLYKLALFVEYLGR